VITFASALALVKKIDSLIGITRRVARKAPEWVDVVLDEVDGVTPQPLPPSAVRHIEAQIASATSLRSEIPTLPGVGAAPRNALPPPPPERPLAPLRVPPPPRVGVPRPRPRARL
jgi:hypothetical protein